MDRNNVVPNSCEQSLCRQQRPPGYEVQASLTSAPFISLIRDPPRIHLVSTDFLQQKIQSLNGVIRPSQPPLPLQLVLMVVRLVNVVTFFQVP